MKLRRRRRGECPTSHFVVQLTRHCGFECIKDKWLIPCLDENEKTLNWMVDKSTKDKIEVLIGDLANLPKLDVLEYSDGHHEIKVI